MNKIDRVFDYVEELEAENKALAHKLKNATERYKANLMSLEDCSDITTKQAHEIKDLLKVKEMLFDFRSMNDELESKIKALKKDREDLVKLADLLVSIDEVD